MTLFEYQLRYWLALSEAHQALADIQAAVGEGSDLMNKTLVFFGSDQFGYWHCQWLRTICLLASSCAIKPCAGLAVV